MESQCSQRLFKLYNSEYAFFAALIYNHATKNLTKIKIDNSQELHSTGKIAVVDFYEIANPRMYLIIKICQF